MSPNSRENSVGTVSAEQILIDKPLTLACGVVLPSHELMVETYGTLNADKKQRNFDMPCPERKSSCSGAL